MTTKPKKGVTTADVDRVAHLVALAGIYVAAARRGVQDGDRMWSCGELANAVHSMRDAAKTSAKIIDRLKGRVSK